MAVQMQLVMFTSPPGLPCALLRLHVRGRPGNEATYIYIFGCGTVIAIHMLGGGGCSPKSTERIPPVAL